MKRRKSKPDQMNWRPTLEDYKLLQELTARLGVSESDILRMGIRALAQQQQQLSKAAD